MNKGNYKCDHCGTVCGWKGNLVVHLRDFHHIDYLDSEGNDGPHACGECGSRFHEKSDLKWHTRRVHLQKYLDWKADESGFYQCDKCSCRRKTRNSLLEHIRINHLRGNDSYSCKRCGKTFSHKSELAQHLRRAKCSHNDVLKQLPCPDCDLTFDNSSLLRHHRVLDHQYSGWRASVEGIFKECGEMYELRRDLLLHIARVHGCTECGMKFNQHNNLERHVMVAHEGRRDFACTECEKTFAQLKDLQRHFGAIHELKFPYACEYCQKRYKYKFVLKYHVIIRHTKDYKHRCTICGKGYILSAHLNHHMKVDHITHEEDEEMVDDPDTPTNSMCTPNAVSVDEESSVDNEYSPESRLDQIRQKNLEELQELLAKYALVIEEATRLGCKVTFGKHGQNTVSGN